MIITICGPSGSGKDTLAEYLLREFPYNVKKLPSYTTRSMRLGEKDGVDYNFISKEKFEEMINNGEFLEYVEYTPGKFYGTAKDDIDKAANSLIIYVMIKTPTGVKEIENIIDDSKLLKVGLTVSDDVRRERFIKRAGDEFTKEERISLEYRIANDNRTFENLSKDSDIIFNNDDNNMEALFKIGDKVFIKALDIIEKFPAERLKHFHEEIEEEIDR